MRQLYVTTIIPVIVYGCAIWFLRGPDVKWSLSNSLLSQLESLQYQCFVHIAGTFKQIPAEYLLKEIFIQPLEVLLERHSIAFAARARPRARDPPLEELKLPPTLKFPEREDPYRVLDRQAQQLRNVAREPLDSTQ